MLRSSPNLATLRLPNDDVPCILVRIHECVSINEVPFDVGCINEGFSVERKYSCDGRTGGGGGWSCLLH